MATLKKSLGAVALVAILAMSFPTLAKGKLGFATEATVSGFFSPVLKRVKIASVAPGSPAAVAGVKPGDYIIEANGRTIEGAPARGMADKLKNVKAGEHLRLKLKRGTEFVTADIVAGG